MDRSPPVPGWLYRMGFGAWLLVGVVLIVMGAIWLLSLTSTITDPLIVGAVIGAVGGALVDRFERHRIPRVAGAALVLLMLVVIAVAVVGLVLGGITSQGDQIDRLTSKAADTLAGYANDLGITSAKDAAQDVKKQVPDIGETLLGGVAHAISGLKNLLVFLGFSIFTSFFLLKDGPAMGRWIERHMGLPPAQARVVTGSMVHALRQYFLGLTIVGAFNATVVGLGALALGLPLPGTIAVVTFLAGYVPFLGAWTAGIFTFLIALADQGPDAAMTMAVIVFLANGPLQQIVQPIAYGATLQLNPLVVFSVTIAAGALFGMVGLILAAPLVSAAVHIHAELTEETAEAGPAPPAAAAEAPA